jgi:hypothetical protein
MAANMNEGESSEAVPLLDLVRRDSFEKDSMDSDDGRTYDLRSNVYVLPCVILYCMTIYRDLS